MRVYARKLLGIFSALLYVYITSIFIRWILRPFSSVPFIFSSLYFGHERRRALRADRTISSRFSACTRLSASAGRQSLQEIHGLAGLVAADNALGETPCCRASRTIRPSWIFERGMQCVSGLGVRRSLFEVAAACQNGAEYEVRSESMNLCHGGLVSSTVNCNAILGTGRMFMAYWKGDAQGEQKKKRNIPSKQFELGSSEQRTERFG